MKKVFSVVLLVSALTMQAMEKGKVSPQQQKKRETSEELLRKAVEALAIEQKEEQEKLEAEKKAAEQKDELGEAWDNLIGDVTNLYSILAKKGKGSVDSLRKEIDSKVKKMNEESSEPCLVTDVLKELGSQWLKFSARVDKKQVQDEEESQPVAEPVQEQKPVISEEEVNELCVGLSDGNKEFFASMVNAQGFTREQLDFVKGLIKESRENQTR